MVVAFASLLHLVLCFHAAVRCIRERWPIGGLAALVRAGLVVVVGLAAVATPLSVTPSPTAAWLSLSAVAAGIGGPILSFFVVYLAWRRTVDVPASQEDAAGRPLAAWVPVGVLDGIFVVMQIGSFVVSRES